MALALDARRTKRLAGDGRALLVWTVVATCGIVVGGYLTSRNAGYHTDAAPFHGRWVLRAGPGIALSVVVAAAGVALGPSLARRSSWRRAVLGAGIAAFVWPLSLALSVGAHGFTSPLEGRFEYLAGIPAVQAPGSFLRTFTSTLPELPTHVKGHPPGLVLVLSALDRIGLPGSAWAALLVVAVGASAVPAVLLTTREVTGEAAARRALPFLVLAPGAVWMGTSGDAFFTGVGAWAIALTVLAASRPARRYAVLAGVAWTAALLCSYGLVLLAPVAAGAALHRRRFDVLLVTGATAVVALAVLGLGTGFWWPAGLAATRRAYLAGYAPHRTAAVFIWLNITAVAIALGPAVAPALRRARGPVLLLAGGAIAGLALADASLMSKAEVERIWLPWMPWVLVACAALLADRRRLWLAAQAGTAVALQLALTVDVVTAAARVLVVDDDPNVAEVVTRYLDREGFRVETVGDGLVAVRRATEDPPDLVVLDLMLPGLDGLEVCRRLRAMAPVPVIMLTAKGEETDRVLGLELGADDYITKPFSPRELTSRVKAVLRRVNAPLPPLELPAVLTAGDIEVDVLAREAKVRGDIVSLTVRELELLIHLLRNPRLAFRREELLEAVWGWTYGDTSTVTVHVRRLREKIERDPSVPVHLVTVWGVGYRFEP